MKRFQELDIIICTQLAEDAIELKELQQDYINDHIIDRISTESI